MENIGPREVEIAKQHNLHHTWLTPAIHGDTCQCCKKLRDYAHYITDTSVCVFCTVACKDKPVCQITAA